MADGSRRTWITDCRISSMRGTTGATTYQQYLARAGAEVLPEHFFIDSSSTLTQQIINTSGVRTNNNYTITDNRTDQLTASIRPSWHQSLGSNAEALLDYEHGIVKYDSGKVAGTTSDSQLDSVSLTANSVSEERRLSWKVNVADQRINYDDNAFDDLKIRHAGLLLGYQIIPGFSPLALIGYEDNDFGDNIGSTDPKDPFWGVGFRWQPNTRSELEALAGHRFFGNTYRVNWRQRGRYLTSELSYTEQIQGEATSALENASLIDNPGVPSAFNLGVSGNAFLSKTVRAIGEFQEIEDLDHPYPVLREARVRGFGSGRECGRNRRVMDVGLRITHQFWHQTALGQDGCRDRQRESNLRLFRAAATAPSRDPGHGIAPVFLYQGGF